jgi:hypothetical protein
MDCCVQNCGKGDAEEQMLLCDCFDVWLMDCCVQNCGKGDAEKQMLLCDGCDV